LRLHSTVRTLALCAGWLVIPYLAGAQTRPAAPPKNHVQIDFELDDLSGAEKTQTQTTVTVTRGVSARSQLFVAVESHNRFGDPDTQISAGLNHVFGARRVMLSASVGAGVNVQTIATREVDVKAQVRVSEHLNPFAEVSYSAYRADTQVVVGTVGGALTWKRLSAQAGLQLTRASVGPRVIREAGTGIGVKGAWRLSPKVSLVANGHVGAEHAVAKTIREAQRAIKAWGASAGLEVAPKPNHTLSISYLYQDRERVYSVRGMVVSGAIGF